MDENEKALAEKRAKHAAYKREWSARNKDKVRKTKRAEYERHRDAYIARAKLAKDKNPERTRSYSRLASGLRRAKSASAVIEKIPVGILEQQLVTQGFKCPYCRCAISLRHSHIDHIVPFKRGGKHVPENIQLTCPSCNCRNASKPPEVFAEQVRSIAP